MSGKIDLNEKPICFEVHPETSKDFLHVMLNGPEKMQVGNQTLGEVIDYVLKNYEESDNSITRAIAQSIILVRNDFDVVYTVNNRRYGSDRLYGRKDNVPDFSNIPINNEDHFTEEKDTNGNKFWMCCIKVFNTHRDY